MTTTFIIPSEAEPAQDPTKARRSKDGRPYIKHPCPLQRGGRTVMPGSALCVDGRTEGSRGPLSKQCERCKGKGYVEELYTRCTTFVSAMEERTQLELWKMRTVLVGVAAGPSSLLAELMLLTPEDREALDRLANQAVELGDGYLKARKGTDLHTLSEYVDQGRPLPDLLTDWETGQERPVTLQDRADMAAYKRLTEMDGIIENWQLFMIASEKFVVNDEFKIGGTYDRLVSFLPQWEHQEGMQPGICPEECGKPMILDLKTGRVDYGAGKIAQQLAVYAHSDDYDPATGQRTPQDVCQHKGIVIHLPQGTGEATVLIVDLVEGWERVKLSSRVREHRRTEKALLTEFSLKS